MLPVKETKHKYLHGKTTAYRVKIKPLREAINCGCDIYMQKNRLSEINEHIITMFSTLDLL